jgi:polysaccharide pyruvyl transferase WcaK-like protein
VTAVAPDTSRAASAASPLPGASRRVLLAGAFGQGNPGDEALLAAFARALPGHRLVAASSAPAATAAAHGVEAIGRDRPAAVARAVADADAVVVAGGTVFKTLHPASGRPPLGLLRRTAALAVATKALRKPLALVGVGAGSLPGAGARALARAIVRAADLLVLRDDESAARLAAAGAPTPFRVGADAAWTILPDGAHSPLPDGAPTPPLPGRGPLVVALSHLAGGPELAGRLAAGLAPLVDAGVAVRLDPWQPAGDAALGAEVAARLGGRARVGPTPATLVAAREELAGARLVLAQRFHALVAAASAGIPALAVAHEPKLEGLARRLEQPAVAPDASPPALAAAIADALDGSPAAPEAVRRERERAAEGFRLLRVLLARGRSDEAVAVDGLALRPEEWLG